MNIFTDLGVFNINKVDKSIQQGLQYTNFNNKTLDVTKYDYIQNNNIKTDTFVEHMETLNEQTDLITIINNLCVKFENVLNEYKDKLLTMNECIIQNKTFDNSTILYKQINKLNKYLIKLGTQLLDLIHKLKLKDSYLNSEIREKQSEINDYLDILSYDKIMLINMKTSYNTLNQSNNDSVLVLRRNNYEYITWSVLALTIGYVIVRKLSIKK